MILAESIFFLRGKQMTTPASNGHWRLLLCPILFLQQLFSWFTLVTLGSWQSQMNPSGTDPSWVNQTLNQNLGKNPEALLFLGLGSRIRL